jgi:hypothetical protein
MESGSALSNGTIADTRLVDRFPGETIVYNVAL